MRKWLRWWLGIDEIDERVEAVERVTSEIIDGDGKDCIGFMVGEDASINDLEDDFLCREDAPD